MPLLNVPRPPRTANQTKGRATVRRSCQEQAGSPSVGLSIGRIMVLTTDKHIQYIYYLLLRQKKDISVAHNVISVKLTQSFSRGSILPPGPTDPVVCDRE